MTNEMALILKMLEEGKITSSQAEELIEAMENKGHKSKAGNYAKPLSDPVNKVLDEFNKNSSTAIKEILGKIDNIYNQLEKTIQFDTKKYSDIFNSIENSLKGELQKISNDLNKNTGSLTAGLTTRISDIDKTIEDTNKLDNIADSLKNSIGNISINVPGLDESITDMINSFSKINNDEKNLMSVITKKIDNFSLTKLNFENICGNISIEGYDEDIIKIHVYCRTSESSIDKILNISDKTNLYSIKIKQKPKLIVNLHVEVPRKKLNRIVCVTSKGRINISGLDCSELKCISASGKISVSGITFDQGEFTTSGSKIECCDITCTKLLIKSLKSPVIIDNIDCTYCEVNTSAERISIILSDEWKSAVELKLKTENARIEAELSLLQDTGVYVDASTTNNSIVIDIPEISYTKDQKESPADTEHITCQNPFYKTSSRTVRVSAFTVNGEISIR